MQNKSLKKWNQIGYVLKLTLRGVGTTTGKTEEWNKLPLCDVKARQSIKFEKIAPFLGSRAGLACFLIDVEAV